MSSDNSNEHQQLRSKAKAFIKRTNQKYNSKEGKENTSQMLQNSKQNDSQQEFLKELNSAFALLEAQHMQNPQEIAMNSELQFSESTVQDSKNINESLQSKPKTKAEIRKMERMKNQSLNEKNQEYQEDENYQHSFTNLEINNQIKDLSSQELDNQNSSYEQDNTAAISHQQSHYQQEVSNQRSKSQNIFKKPQRVKPSSLISKKESRSNHFAQPQQGNTNTQSKNKSVSPAPSIKEVTLTKNHQLLQQYTSNYIAKYQTNDLVFKPSLNSMTQMLDVHAKMVDQNGNKIPR